MKTLSNANERLVNKDGVPTEQNYLYLLQLNQLLNGQLFPKVPRYADLADIQSKIKKPEVDVIYGTVTGQGPALWNGSQWVRAADDSTPIV